MPRPPAVARARVERKVYFYRVDVGTDETGGPRGFDPVPPLQYINRLPFTSAGRYLEVSEDTRRLEECALMDHVYATIRHAIINKLQVIATYHGYPREMCPHVIGIKRGKPATRGKGRKPGKPATPDEEHALFYQFGGQSESGLKPDGSPANWRCIRIAELSNVSTRSGPWHTAPNHTRPQTCADEIDVEASG